CLRGGGGHV
nr:immunoglobulin heavy chain junction region [Homo sapiens]MOK32870.1 immunoglobulin heavy chain junction region [Homo sapiens]MOK58009.1 immunoglobulin heavy chain junction region [Homo sapiens]